MKRKGGKAPSPTREEVLVVGAGAVGAACAASMASAGLRVRVLAHPSRNTTAVSGGHLLLQSKRPGPLLELARRSLDLVAEFAAGREADLQYSQRGSLLLATTADEEAVLRDHFEALHGAGVPVSWLDGEAARAREPALSGAVRAASFCPLDAQLHPPSLAGAYLQEAMARGAVLHGNKPVEGWVTQGGRVCGVVAGGQEFPATAVVLAGGPWSGELAAMAGVDLGLKPRRGVLLRGFSGPVLTTRPLLGAAYLAAKFGEEPGGVAFSFQQLPDGECVLGGSREFVEFSPAPEPDLESRIRECGSRYLPGLAGVEWERVDVGFRPWTADGLPRIGASGVPGLYLACGHEGDGITLAAVTAERITTELAGTRK